TKEEKKAEVSLKVSWGKTFQKISVPLVLKAGTTTEHYFELPPVQEGTLSLTASAKTDKDYDEITEEVNVRPRANVIRVGTGGVATVDVKKVLTLPEKNLKNVQVGVQYGPSLSSVLLSQQPNSLSDGMSVASRGLTAYQIVRYLEGTEVQSGGLYEKWFNTFEGAVLHLMLNQNSDGGFTYSGMNSTNARQKATSQKSFYAQSDAYVSALSLRLIALAKERGIPGLEDCLTRGQNYLKNQFSRATTNVEKAAILYGLVETGAIDFAYLNRLHRERNQLDSYSLSLLTLLFSHLDRKVYAQEVAQILAKRDLTQPDPVPSSMKEKQSLCWSRDHVELMALAANAFIMANSPRSQVEPLLEKLMEYRGYQSWSSPKANAAATEALTNYLLTYKPARDVRYRLELLLNGKSVHTAEIQGGEPIQELYFPLPDGSENATLELKL
ncbi:MAG: hypothetical protein KDK61_07475, partial [Simkania sp.]|nr:hypothetical protein [Simkania sp.]